MIAAWAAVTLDTPSSAQTDLDLLGVTDPLLEPDTLGVALDPGLEGVRLAMENGEYASAAAELSDFLLRRTGHVQALRLLASCYLHLDDLEQSIQASLQVAAEDTLDAGILSSLGYLYHRSGDLDNASLYYRLAEEKDPLQPYSRFGRAWIYVSRRDFETAHELATRITELAPDFSENYLLLGRVLTAKGLYREAARSYRHAFRLDPELRTSYGVLLQELTLRHGVTRR